MSRSVMTPITQSLVSIIGISPQSFRSIIFATSSSVVWGLQHTGFGVMMSRANVAIRSSSSLDFRAFFLGPILTAMLATPGLARVGDLQPPAARNLARGRLDDNLEHTVVEVRFGAVRNGALGQRHDAVEAAVAALAAIVALAILFVLFAPFAFDRQRV